MYRLLIVDDEQKIREVIREYAEFNGFEVSEAADGMSAIGLCKLNDYDLIIMDIMMPRLDGFSACKEIKKIKNIPMIMLSARSEEYDKLFGFELGIDDYVVKPFSPKELMARINAVLRRVEEKEIQHPAGAAIVIDELTIDPERHQVIFRGEKVELTSREFDLIHFLGRNRGVVFTRDQLLDKVWGIDYAGETRTVDVHIRYIRRKLGLSEQEDRYIQTIRGKGYKMA